MASGRVRGFGQQASWAECLPSTRQLSARKPGEERQPGLLTALGAGAQGRGVGRVAFWRGLSPACRRRLPRVPTRLLSRGGEDGGGLWRLLGNTSPGGLLPPSGRHPTSVTSCTLSPDASQFGVGCQHVNWVGWGVRCATLSQLPGRLETWDQTWSQRAWHPWRPVTQLSTPCPRVPGHRPGLALTPHQACDRVRFPTDDRGSET